MAEERLSSLDVFRGITIAGMTLVNNPGSWDYVYPPLRHAEWHGWTPTDLVFPFFLFIVGVAISLSFSRKIEKGIEKPNLYFKIVKRSIILFALGILLALIFRFNFSTLRIPGVLQRIALCYLFTSLLFLNVRAKGRVIATFLILASYWLIMKLVPVPGYGAGVLSFEGNLCGYIDTKLLAGHLYKAAFDPEGILSTLPAISTTLLGTLSGDWLRSSKTIIQKTEGIFIAGILFTLSGLLLHPFFPINKQLWTSTYVLLTAGLALLLLGVCCFLMDWMRIRKWAAPFLILGTNAIAVYVGSTLMVKLMALIKVSAGGKALPLRAYIYSKLLAPWAGAYIGSLIYPLLLILLWIGIMIPLYRKKIFIKI
jgi:predicted acyltransferase